MQGVTASVVQDATRRASHHVFWIIAVLATSMRPLWSGLGLLPMLDFIIPVLLTLAFIRTLRSISYYGACKRQIRVVGGIWLLFLCIYCVSLLIHCNSEPASRIVASLHDYVTFTMVLVMIILVGKLNSVPLDVLIRSILTFQVVCASIVVLSWCLHQVNGIEFPSLLGGLVSALLPYDQVRQYSRVVLFYQDWIAGHPFPRTSFTFPYPNALAGTAMLLFSIYMVLVPYVRGRRDMKRRTFIVAVATVAILAGTLSRITVLACGLALVLKALVRAWRGGNKALFGLVLVVLIALSFLLAADRQHVWSYVSNLRAGSSSVRLALYVATIEVIRTSPIIGLGVRPIWSGYPVPLGSHNTYLGVALYAGLLGLAVFVGFLVYVFCVGLRKLISVKDDVTRRSIEWGFAAFIASLVWMIGEDIEGVMVVCVWWAILVSLLLFLSSHTAIERNGWILVLDTSRVSQQGDIPTPGLMDGGTAHALRDIGACDVTAHGHSSDGPPTQPGLRRL